jgi:hypothetical protein
VREIGSRYLLRKRRGVWQRQCGHCGERKISSPCRESKLCYSLYSVILISSCCCSALALELHVLATSPLATDRLGSLPTLRPSRDLVNPRICWPPLSASKQHWPVLTWWQARCQLRILVASTVRLPVFLAEFVRFGVWNLQLLFLSLELGIATSYSGGARDH